MKNENNLYAAEPNRDPITGEPGAHPVGTGIGAALGGAAAGAVTGTAAGPIGTIVGAALGAIVGGLAGKSAAEAIDPTAEDTYWRDNYMHRPYGRDASYDDYGPAYGYGVAAYRRFPGQSLTMWKLICRAIGQQRGAARSWSGRAPVKQRVMRGCGWVARSKGGGRRSAQR